MSRLLIEAQKIIQINSMSNLGNEELANYLVSLFQEAGIDYKLQQVTHSLEEVSKRQFNILGIIGDPLVDRKTKKGLLLLSNLDTVNPGMKEHWTETGGLPFSGETKNGYIYGVGAASKIDFLCKLFAAKKMKEHKHRMPIYIGGVCGNNLGMLGARYLVQSNALNPRYVFVSHPTSGFIGGSHNGSAAIKIHINFQTVEKDARGFNRGLSLYFNGKQGRCSLDKKNHAIEKMLELVQLSFDRGFELRFKDLGGGEYTNVNPDQAFASLFLTSHQFEDYKRFLREKEKQKDENDILPPFKIEFGVLGESGVSFLPEAFLKSLQKIKKDIDTFLDVSIKENKKIKINLGRISHKNNKVELSYHAFFEENFEEIEKTFKDTVAAASEQFPKLNISIQIEKKVPTFKANPESFLLDASKKLLENMDVSPDVIHSTEPSSAGLFYDAGYETCFFGAADLENNLFHPNEKISLEKIQFVYDFYLKLIERICL